MPSQASCFTCGLLFLATGALKFYRAEAMTLGSSWRRNSQNPALQSFSGQGGGEGEHERTAVCVCSGASVLSSNGPVPLAAHPRPSLPRPRSRPMAALGSLSPWLSQLPGLPTRRVKSSRAAVRGDELGGAGLAVRPAPYPSDHVPLAAEGGGLLAFSSPCQSLFPGALSMATEASGPRPGY